MSIKVITHVWEHSQQRGSALLMLLAIADNANEDGEAWPSIPTLAHKCRMTERNAQMLIHRLEAAGELTVQHRRRGEKNETNLFTIAVPWRKTAPEGRKGLVKAASPPGESGFTIPGESGFTTLVKTASPDPSIEPSIEPSKKLDAPSGAAGNKPAKEYEDIPHTTRTAIIEAWLKNLSAPPVQSGNVYANTTNHKLAAAIARAGYTVEDVRRYVAAMQTDNFWRDKALKLKNVADNLPAWIRTHPAAEPETPAAPPPESDVVSVEKQAEARQLFEQLVAAHNANTVKGNERGNH